MNTIQHVFLWMVLVASSSIAIAQQQNYSFADLDSLNSIEQRKVVIFIHTDWCKFCAQMKHTTLQHEKVTEILNEHFYLIHLNAEYKKGITYLGHTFNYKPTGGNTGVHELAEQLGTIDGKMNYPTLCILNEKNEIIFQYGGLMKSDELVVVLKEVVKE